MTAISLTGLKPKTAAAEEQAPAAPVAATAGFTGLSKTTKLPTITRPEVIRFVKALIYGPSGHGKTRFLGTALDDERTNPMMFLDYEGGTSTLVGKPMDIVRIRDWQDYNEVYAYLKNGDHPYKSVGLDSISETHIFALFQIIEADVRRKNPDLIEQGDYGIASVQMRRLLRAFRDLDMHVFAISLATEEVDPRVGKVKRPSLVGKLADEAPGIFDVVGYLAMEQGPDGVNNRWLLLNNYPQFRVKARTPWEATIPNELENPTVTSLLDALQIPFPTSEGDPDNA